MVYQQQRICDLETCKVKLRFQNEENWKHYLIHKPNLRQYVDFKSNYEMEPYINLVNNKFGRSLIARLRRGILRPNVEPGRFNQTRLEDRLCKVCEEGFDEDEIHFVCECSKYRDRKRKLLPKNFK